MDFLGFTLPNNLFVAPMAGVTDRPFRILCKKMGAGLAVSEMVTSNSLLYGSEKTKRRADHTNEPAPIVVQIAGADPKMLAEAARYNVDCGAQIIDINMGCPAKKICNVMAGSALMKDEKLVGKICEMVVATVPNTPVTLKCRTGWDFENKNALSVAKIAQNAGIRAIAIHGRTRCQQYKGQAEFETIKIVKENVKIPVIANGDIDSPQKALDVLNFTAADALMIGRAAQGRPWIFREIAHFLKTGEILESPTRAEIGKILLSHLANLYDFYGEKTGLFVARKHIHWYTKGIAYAAEFRKKINSLETTLQQMREVELFFIKG